MGRDVGMVITWEGREGGRERGEGKEERKGGRREGEGKMSARRYTPEGTVRVCSLTPLT